MEPCFRKYNLGNFWKALSGNRNVSQKVRYVLNGKKRYLDKGCNTWKPLWQTENIPVLKGSQYVLSSYDEGATYGKR